MTHRAVAAAVLAFPLLALAASTGHAAPAAPANLDLESGELASSPPGWLARSLPEGAYRSALTDREPKQGLRCALVESTAGVTGQFGNLMQSVDATPFRGKRVRWRAFVRVDGATPGARAQLWMRVDRPSGDRGFFDNMGDRPITSPAWEAHEIVGDVAPDAEAIAFGLIVPGLGRAFLDDASLTVLGEAGQGNQPARALSGRGLENLVALTRLLGYVRYFHPADTAASAKWDEVALEAVDVVEPAPTPEALALALESVFRPIAPTVRVFTTGHAPELPKELVPPSGAPAPRSLSWRHFGVGTGDQRSIYSSTRVGSDESALDLFGSATMLQDASTWRGKRVRFSAAVRAEPVGTGGGAHLILVVQRPEGLRGFADAMEDRPVRDAEWTYQQVTGYVADDALAVSLGLALSGSGVAWFDDVKLEVLGFDDTAVPVALPNGGFEEAGMPFRADETATNNGYALSHSADRPAEGAQCLALSRASAPGEEPARPDEPFVADLGGGVSCLVPLALFVDETGTLPHVEAVARARSSRRPDGFTPSGDDRATRLADVALAWNVFQHFYPYFDLVRTDWRAELSRALERAATDRDARAFLDTLRLMVAALHDGHGNVYHASDAPAAALPLAWEWAEGQLVVTHVAPEAGALARGDVVLRIDGREVGELAREKGAFVSAATPQWRAFRLLDILLRGAAGSVARLDVRSSEGAERTVEVARVPGAGVEEPRLGTVSELRPGVMYVDLDRATLKDLAEAMPRLEAARGLVVDLRGYPATFPPILLAHLTSETITSPRWNVPVVTRPDRKTLRYRFSNWPVEPRAPRLRAKVAYLTGGGAVSAAETVMGIVEHYRLAEIVGGPTAGTNGNINPFTLPGGYQVIWTGMRVEKHDGSPHHGVGIGPTVPVSRTIRGIAAGRDEVLERAIAIVSAPPEGS